MTPDPSSLLQSLEKFLSLPRETVPQLTATETRKTLRGAADMLGLEFVEIEGLAPTFLLLPPAGQEARVTFFAAWHAEVLPVLPAAVEGAERLALATTLAGIEKDRQSATPVAVVVAPGATQGSLVLAKTLRDYRARLRAPQAFWLRIMPRAPQRRRVYLGARGRLVLGIWNTGVNAYRLRDSIVEELGGEAYGPRPLDFELIRKLAQSRDAQDFLEEALDSPGTVAGSPEDRLKSALFAPRGQVVSPQVKHPDRPHAWLILELTEGMDPVELLERARRLAGDAKIEMAEGFASDRISIHHPAIQAEIKLSKDVSQGPDIWPLAPWISPSGVFSGAIGTPLAEWGIPVNAAVAVRFPKPEQFEALASEAAQLLRRVHEETPAVVPPGTSPVRPHPFA